MKKIVLALLLITGCGGDGGMISTSMTDKMEMSLAKNLRFMRLPQFTNTCVAYAWMGNNYGGPIAFIVPCEGMNSNIQAPCVPMGSIER